MPKDKQPVPRRRYDSKLKAEVKMLYIDRELSPRQISEMFKGRPTAQVIDQWASRKDPNTSMSWKDEKGNLLNDNYARLSPQAQAKKIMRILDAIVDKQIPGDYKGLSQLADALAKVNKSLEKVVDKDFQIPMLFEFLSKLVGFLNLHYKEILTPQLSNALKHFKNDLRKQFESGL